MRTYARNLSRQIGGEPTPVQAAMISRAASIAALLRGFDRQANNGDGSTIDPTYAKLSNSLTLILRVLAGGPPRAPKPPPLAPLEHKEATRPFAASSEEIATAWAGEKPPKPRSLTSILAEAATPR
jgi:hypothetical protein